jgi:RNA polymerase sigma-70 factor (ECF subfamily)
MSIEDPSKSVPTENRDPDPRRDEDLMALLRSGRDEPLGVLMTRHGAELLRFFLLRSRDPHTSQDLANETFYRIFSKARTFEPTKPFRPWFFTVATNVWRAWLRRRQPPEVPLQMLSETAAEPAPSARDSGTDRAARLLEQLSEIDRDILVLRHYEGLKLKEIAQRLGLSPGAVYTRLFRALEKLRGPGAKSDPV